MWIYFSKFKFKHKLHLGKINMHHIATLSFMEQIFFAEISISGFYTDHEVSCHLYIDIKYQTFGFHFPIILGIKDSLVLG